MNKQKIVVLSGAGVSAESGLSTFRDNGGLWCNIDPMKVASIQGWLQNPRLVLDFYNERRAQLETAQPNKAHKIIAELEKNYDVAVITQNVDNLHERAGSTRVLHLHGELTKVRPENSYTEQDNFSESKIIDIGYKKIHYGDEDKTGVQLRPHIVFFGEAVPNIETAARLVELSDILIIIGTSMQVYPAASLYSFTKPTTPIYVIDPKEVAIKDPRFIHIKQKASDGMETLITVNGF